MDVRPLGIDGSWLFTPRQFADDRGVFLEWFQAARLAAAVGHPLALAQANHSISRRGTVRGIHFSDVPPGQAKYLYCSRGAVQDVVVDIRTGSPTYGRWEAVRLDDSDRCGLYLAEGLGHGFRALTDDASVTYLCSTPYDPAREHTVDPMDPAIGIRWDGDDEPLLSPRDAAAPSLASAAAAGLLPAYDACRRHYDALRSGGQ